MRLYGTQNQIIKAAAALTGRPDKMLLAYIRIQRDITKNDFIRIDGVKIYLKPRKMYVEY